MKRTLILLTMAMVAGWFSLTPALSCDSCAKHKDKDKKEQPTDSGEKKCEKKS